MKKLFGGSKLGLGVLPSKEAIANKTISLIQKAITPKDAMSVLKKEMVAVINNTEDLLVVRNLIEQRYDVKISLSPNIEEKTFNVNSWSICIGDIEIEEVSGIEEGIELLSSVVLDKEKAVRFIALMEQATSLGG